VSRPIDPEELDRLYRAMMKVTSKYMKPEVVITPAGVQFWDNVAGICTLVPWDDVEVEDEPTT